MGIFQRFRTGVKNAVNKVKEIGSRVMQGVTYVAGKAVGYVEQAAMLMHWDSIAEASRGMGEALEESHDHWKKRADIIEAGRILGPNTRPKHFTPNKDVRNVAEATIQVIEDKCKPKPGSDLSESFARLTPEGKCDLINSVGNGIADHYGLHLAPVKFVFSDDFGSYSPSENCISINASLVASENTYIAMEQLYTVIHETMHAIQYHAVKQEVNEPGSSGFDPQLVCEWANNFLPGHYIRSEVDPERYRNQPLERDAFGLEWLIKSYFNMIGEHRNSNNDN